LAVQIINSPVDFTKKWLTQPTNLPQLCSQHTPHLQNFPFCDVLEWL
jgi:hypothetical protein